MILALVAILVIANFVLLGANPLRVMFARRLRHRAVESVDPTGIRASETPQRGPEQHDSADDDGWAAAAIEAFVDEVSPVSGRVAPALPRPLEAAPKVEPVAVAARTADPGPPVQPEPSRPSALRWIPDGLADQATWDRTIHDESARAARFGRPPTVVVAGLHQLHDLADRLGQDVADRVITETARLLVKEGRAADRIAWLGDSTFGVLLLETGEFEARGYVNRVRTAADQWLESAGLSVRLSLGWASPGEGGNLRAAVAMAQQRMQDAGRASADEPDDNGRRRDEVLIRVSQRRSPRPAG
jgi:diguanylate cyclase (GGDEF)-like protein